MTLVCNDSEKPTPSGVAGGLTLERQKGVVNKNQGMVSREIVEMYPMKFSL